MIDLSIKLNIYLIISGTVYSVACTLNGGHEARGSNRDFLGAAWDAFASIKLGLFASVTLFVNCDVFEMQRVKINWEWLKVSHSKKKRKKN